MLDHHANRDIPDHMDRLPRDVAQERLHHDIVRLLDEHIPRSNHHVMPMSSSQASSANRNNDVAAQNEPVLTGTTGRPPKPKKRPKSTVAAARETQRHLGSSVSNLEEAPVAAATNTATKRRTNTNSRKKKSDNAGSTNTVQSVDSISTVSLTLSPANSHSLESPPTGKINFVNRLITGSFNFEISLPVDMGATPSPYSVMTYGGSHPHMPSGNPPQPPPYDECMKTAASMQAIHMSNMDPSTNYGYVHYDYRNHLPQQQHQQQSTIHQRQTSLPASTVSSAMNTNLQQQAMSYNVLAVNTAYQSSLSPPQFALSPPASSYAGSPPQQNLVQNGITSPSKGGSRPSLPTSPTHIAAMRAAAQQRTGFEFPETMMSYRNTNTGGMPQYYQQHYPTPPHSHMDPSPSQHALHPPEAYLTPSPESPGQWSSASPHSTSDWSEGMSSPPNPNMSFVPPSHAKHTEGIYI